MRPTIKKSIIPDQDENFLCKIFQPSMFPSARNPGNSPWGISSVGRAPAWHAGGQRFEPAMLHQGKLSYRTARAARFANPPAIIPMGIQAECLGAPLASRSGGQTNQRASREEYR